MYLFDPWTVAYQAPPSRQEYWNGLPFPSPGDLPDPGIKPGSPTLQADALPSEHQGRFLLYNTANQFMKVKVRQSCLTLCDPVDYIWFMELSRPEYKLCTAQPFRATGLAVGPQPQLCSTKAPQTACRAVSRPAPPLHSRDRGPNPAHEGSDTTKSNASARKNNQSYYCE